MDELTRRRILARRALLVAAAIAGATTSACPQVCLEPLRPDIPTNPPSDDAGLSAAPDAAPPVTTSTVPEPAVCLSPAMPR